MNIDGRERSVGHARLLCCFLAGYSFATISPAARVDDMADIILYSALGDKNFYGSKEEMVETVKLLGDAMHLLYPKARQLKEAVQRSRERLKDRTEVTEHDVPGTPNGVTQYSLEDEPDNYRAQLEPLGLWGLS